MYSKECDHSCLYNNYSDSLDLLRNKIRKKLKCDLSCVLVNAIIVEEKVETLIMIKPGAIEKMGIFSIAKAPDKIDEVDINGAFVKDIRMKLYAIGIKYY